MGEPVTQPISGLESFIRRNSKTITLALILATIGVLIWAGWMGAQQYVACSTISDRLTKGTIDACTACDMAADLGIIRSTAPTSTYP